MKQLFTFPDPVNESSARIVAAGVVILTSAFLITHSSPILWVLAYGFVARVLTGPTLSPLGQLVTRGITPRLAVVHRFVPGPPKRFAQGIGAMLSVGAVVAYHGFDSLTSAIALVAAITFAATLESVFGYCLGCKMFYGLMKLGVVPESICQACAPTRTSLAVIGQATRGGDG